MTLVWDWNGTLLDDTDASIAALNDMLKRRHIPSCTRKFYRDNFLFPVRTFYTRCGMELEKENWDSIAVEYHDAYFSKCVSLFPDTFKTLERASALGFNQVLLSNLRQDFLSEAAKKFELTNFFHAIRGSNNLNGASKIESAKCFIRELGFNKEDLIFIGDSLHDLEVAEAIGAKCILFGGGTHSPDRLFPKSPTALSLTEALAIATTLKRRQ